MIVNEAWEVLGDGKTIEEAIRCAHEYEQHEMCSYCGKGPDSEKGWRAFPITRSAHSMLTCGGPYTDEIQNGEFTWAEEQRALIWIPFVYCIRCRGLDSRGCECEGGTWPREGIEWIEPPADACLWEGADDE